MEESEEHLGTAKSPQATARADTPIPLFGKDVPVTPLAGSFADLTLMAAFDDLAPSPPELQSLAGGRFGPFDLAGYESKPLVEGLLLKLLMRNKPEFAGPRVPMEAMNDKMNLPAALDLSDGSTIVADLGCFFIKEIRIATSGGKREQDGMLMLDHWVQGPPPVAWFGIVEGANLERGNLYLSEGEDPLRDGRFTRTALRLEGNYLWHLIQRKNECVALIDPGGVPLDPHLLSFDFHALQVTLGKPLCLGLLSGLDANGRPTSWAAPLSGGHRRVTTSDSYASAPLPDRGRPEVWEPEFFRALAKAMSNSDAKPFFLATNAYLDSASEGTLDGKYLVLQITLEALCRYDQPDLPDLVADRAAWMSWVTQNKAAIEALAPDALSAGVLLEHVRQAFQQRPATDAVQFHLNELGLKIPDDLRNEIRGRHQAAHRLFMNADDERRDWHRDIDRIIMVRTLLLAVLAKRIGYCGPIVGWANGNRQGLPPWWNVTADPENALRRFHCRRPAQLGAGSR